MRNHPVTFGITILAVLTLAGCGSSNMPSTPKTTAPKTSTAIPAIPEGTGVIAGAHMTSCDTAVGEVTAKGTFVMPAGEKGSPVISVSWVNSRTSTVYARGVSQLSSLEAGQSARWSVKAALPADAATVACVPGAVIPQK